MSVFLITLIISACQPITTDVETMMPPNQVLSLTLTMTPTPPIPASIQRESDSVSVGKPHPTNSTIPEIKFQLCSPLAEHEINDLPSIVSDPYDPPPLGKDDRHHGVDFAYYNQGGRESIEGEGVAAILPGSVAAVLEDRLPYGNMVIIETQHDDLWPELIRHLEIVLGESLYHLYAHFGQPPSVTLGQRIECVSIDRRSRENGVQHTHTTPASGDPCRPGRDGIREHGILRHTRHRRRNERG